MEIKVKKVHNLLRVLWHDLGLETKNGSPALRLYHLAILVWPGCQKAIAKNRLSKIRRDACLETTGAIHTTKRSAMEALACIPPFDLAEGGARSVVH